MLKLLLASLMPLVTVGLSLVSLYPVYERTRQNETVRQSQDIAQAELKKVVSMFNFKLNLLREELYHLYSEQLNLVHALNEIQRGKALFFRRNHLHAFATLALKNNKWEVSKIFARETNEKLKKDGEWLKKIKTNANSPEKSHEKSQFWIEQLTPRLVLVELLDTQSSLVMAAVLDVNYVFPYCRYLSESKSRIFILNDQGQVLCHSNPELEMVSFKNFSSFRMIEKAGEEPTLLRYADASAGLVSAAVRRIQTGLQSTRFFLVAEVPEVKNWELPVSEEDLKKAAVAILIVTVISIGFLARLLLRAQKKIKSYSVDTPKIAPKIAPKIDGLGIELGEFEKLRTEIKDLEYTVLEQETKYAELTRIEKELLTQTDQIGMLLKVFDRWELSALWLAHVEDKLILQESIRWPDISEAEVVGVGEQRSLSFFSDSQIMQKIHHKFGSDIRIFSVDFQRDGNDVTLGVFILRGDFEKNRMHLEIVPQLCRILGFTRGVERQSALY